MSKWAKLHEAMKIADFFHFSQSKSPFLWDLAKKWDETPAILTPKCNFAGFDRVCISPLSLSHRPEQKSFIEMEEEK